MAHTPTSSKIIQVERLIRLARQVATHNKEIGAPAKLKKVVQVRVTDRNPLGEYRIANAWCITGVSVFLTEYGKLIIPVENNKAVVARHREWWKKHPDLEKRVYCSLKTAEDIHRYSIQLGPTLDQIENDLNTHLS